MSQSFNATTDTLIGGTTAIPTTGTLAYWFYPTWAWNDGVDHYLWSVINSTTLLFEMRKFSDNNFYCGWYNSGAEHRVSTAASGLSTNAWNHLLMTWDDTANEVKLYLAGSQIGSTMATLTTFATTGEKHFGNINDASPRDCRGRLAECGLWNRVLGAAEIAALADGFSPHFFRRGGLNYWPLTRTLHDLWGGDTLTASSVDVAEHCRIIRPSKPQVVFHPAAAPGGTILRHMMQYAA